MTPFTERTTEPAPRRLLYERNRYLLKRERALPARAPTHAATTRRGGPQPAPPSRCRRPLKAGEAPPLWRAASPQPATASPSLTPRDPASRGQPGRQRRDRTAGVTASPRLGGGRGSSGCQVTAAPPFTRRSLALSLPTSAPSPSRPPGRGGAAGHPDGQLPQRRARPAAILSLRLFFFFPPPPLPPPQKKNHQKIQPKTLSRPNRGGGFLLIYFHLFIYLFSPSPLPLRKTRNPKNTLKNKIIMHIYAYISKKGNNSSLRVCRKFTPRCCAL